MRDIISANINTMLEKAEDPEKLIKLMIREMEDTLIEVKASCAGAMATKKKIQRELEECTDRSESWGEKAQLAVDKGRDFGHGVERGVALGYAVVGAEGRLRGAPGVAWGDVAETGQPAKNIHNHDLYLKG